MAEPRAFVKNALNPAQRTYADRKVRERDEILRASRIQMLRSPAGRVVLWDLLARLGIFASAWDERTARHSWLAGRQDFGYELRSELIAADEDAYQLMEREARNFIRRLNAETDAVHQGRSEEQGDHDG